MFTNTRAFCKVFEYGRNADLSSGRTLGVTAQFLKIIELQFGPKMPCIVFFILEPSVPVIKVIIQEILKLM